MITVREFNSWLGRTCSVMQGAIVWRHDPTTVFKRSGSTSGPVTVRLLGMVATPLGGVRLRSAADGKNVPTAAVAYYTVVFKSKVLTGRSGAEKYLRGVGRPQRNERGKK